MSVPKKRKSSQRTRQGRSHDALKAKKMSKCSKCGKPKMPHTVCPSCGSYKGREVVKAKVKKTAKK